ncbi:MAG: type II secretion system protein, partial [Rhodanobacter sp.]
MKPGIGNGQSGIVAWPLQPSSDLPRCSHSPFPIPHSRRAQRANGFTLLEMLVVIALIGLAAVAVSVSVTQGLASARVRAASSELAG